MFAKFSTRAYKDTANFGGNFDIVSPSINNIDSNVYEANNIHSESLVYRFGGSLVPSEGPDLEENADHRYSEYASQFSCVSSE